MATVTLNRYRFGVIVGILGTIGAINIFEGLEVLLFNGLLIQWTPVRAMISIGVGVGMLVLAYLTYQWFASVANVMEAESEGNEV